LLYPAPTVQPRSPSPGARGDSAVRNTSHSPSHSPRRSASPTTKALRQQWAELRARVASPMNRRQKQTVSDDRPQGTARPPSSSPKSLPRETMLSVSLHQHSPGPQVMVRTDAREQQLARSFGAKTSVANENSGVRSPKRRFPPREQQVPVTVPILSASMHDLLARVPSAGGLSIAASAASTTASTRDLLTAASTTASNQDLNNPSPMASPMLSRRSSKDLASKEDLADTLARLRVAARIPPRKVTLGRAQENFGGA